MEYGLRIATLKDALNSAGKWRDMASLKPQADASLTSLYFGTEFCQELLPGIRETEAFCAHCRENGFESVLLTPLVTYRGLNRLSRLLDHLSRRGWNPAIVFNDWGVLELLQTRYPRLPRYMGRLMNRGLRDPRLEMRDERQSGENTGRGTGIRKLATSLGVIAVETDADLDPGYLGSGHRMRRTLHIPYTFVSSGRNCLERAAASSGRDQFTRSLASGCNAPCRGRFRQESRTDTQKPIWRAGNTVFFEAPAAWISRHLALADRLVLHERPMP